MMNATLNTLPNGLMSLVKQLGRDDLATVEALLNDMTGNRVAALMLRQLLRWWPKATNADGWVYKSHQDWWAELRIKQSELPKANGALERVGVVMQNKKANGAPTKHYRLNLKQFFKVLAITLKLSAKKLALLLKNAFADSGKMDLVNGSKSITTSPSTKPSTNQHAVLPDTAIEEAKKVPGISDATARRLVSTYGPERVAAMAKLVCSRHFDLPAGAFISGLRDQWECQPVEAPQTNSWERNDTRKYTDDAPGATLPPGWPPAGLPDDDDTQPVDVPTGDEPTEPEGTEGEISQPESQIWKQIMQQLEIQLDRASFFTYLRGVEFVRCDHAGWVLSAPNATTAAMLNYRIMRDIQRVAEDVTGAPVEMVFEVRKMVLA